MKKTQMLNPIETQSVDRCFDADVSRIVLCVHVR